VSKRVLEFTASRDQNHADAQLHNMTQVAFVIIDMGCQLLPDVGPHALFLGMTTAICNIAVMSGNAENVTSLLRSAADSLATPEGVAAYEAAQAGAHVAPN
jgi:hypothetical protein